MDEKNDRITKKLRVEVKTDGIDELNAKLERATVLARALNDELGALTARARNEGDGA
ncbi:hypothetical protein [Olsenella phocaeensis]|uniref:hypothetical protein n=1 Tax=Olsenella phocaeensis TaxID=1852385 RepID=UPI0013563A70|nr:hypothetical protein [Olsenella phocaeensis]